MTASDVKDQVGEGVAPAEFVNGEATTEALRSAAEDYAAALK